MQARAVRQVCLRLTLLVTLTSPAIAGGDVASEFGLGTLSSFPTEGQAKAGCGGDPVVWADPKTGFYYPKFAPEYGKSPTGSFTCYKQAKRADYWGLGSSDSMESRQGRVIPFTNNDICVWYQDKGGDWHCGNAGT